MKNKIIIATIRPWNISNSYKFKNLFCNNYEVFLFFRKEEVIFEKIKKINPTHIFFPHWSWIIPKDVYENYCSIAFHPTDLPYGRGGSPIQNLIANKTYNTKISAFKIGKELDAGDIYLKRDFCIQNGNAQKIFQKLSKIIFFDMIPYVLKNNPLPQKQKGKATLFKRRKFENSNLEATDITNLTDFYDFVRMLDAEEYPKAFIKINNELKISFSNIKKEENKLEGKFEITTEPKETK